MKLIQTLIILLVLPLSTQAAQYCIEADDMVLSSATERYNKASGNKLTSAQFVQFLTDRELTAEHALLQTALQRQFIIDTKACLEGGKLLDVIVDKDTGEPKGTCK